MRITALYISPGHNFVGRFGSSAGTYPGLAVPEVECVAGRGLRKDRYFDHRPDYKGQITFFAEEVYDQLCAELNFSDKPRQACRRNAFTQGTELNALIGREFTVQGIRFFGTEECRPCAWMNEAFGPGAEEFLKGRGGLRARILTDGWLRVTG